MEESLESNNDIACCLKCRKGFKKINSIHGHYAIVHIFNNDKNIIEKRNSGIRKSLENIEHKNKRIVGIKRSRQTLEFKEKASKNLKKRWNDPEQRRKMLENLKKRWQNHSRKKGYKIHFKNSVELSKERSESAKKRWQNPEYKEKMKKISESYEYKKNLSECTKKAWENSQRRNNLSEESKKRWKDEKFRKNFSSKMKKAWQRPEMLKNYSEKSKKMWNNVEKRNQIVRAALKASYLSPNKCEQSLQQVLNELYPNEYKFVGDGEVVIGGFSPDFINCNGKKLIVEFDGNYWHYSEKVKEKDQRKLLKYKELGFDTLVIKENEFKNDKESVRNRIVEFVKNYEKEHYSLLV